MTFPMVGLGDFLTLRWVLIKYFNQRLLTLSCKLLGKRCLESKRNWVTAKSAECWLEQLKVSFESREFLLNHPKYFVLTLQNISIVLLE